MKSSIKMAAMALFTALVLVGCGQVRQQQSGSASVVFGLSGNACTRAGSFMEQGVPAGVARIVLHLSDAKGSIVKRMAIDPASLERQGLLVPELKPGKYAMDLVACGKNSSPLYGAHIGPVVVAENRKTRVRAFLPKLGAMNCVGGANISPLVPEFKGDGFSDTAQTAFACAARYDNRFWVLGGFNSISGNTTAAVGQLAAGTAVWEYRADLGLFVRPVDAHGKVMSLPVPWAAGHCISTRDGVVMVGGVQSGEVGPAKYPGTQPPVMLKVEKGESLRKTGLLLSAKGVGTLRLPEGVYPYSSVTDLGAGLFMVCGGMKGDGSAVGSCAVLQEKSGSVVHVRDIGLNVPRYGHSATLLDSGEVLIIGGYSQNAQDMPIELVDPKGRSTMALKINVTSSRKMPWTAFHAAWLVSKGKVLIVGGNRVTPAGSDQSRPAAISGVRKGAELISLDGSFDKGYEVSVTDLDVTPDTQYKQDPWTMVSMATTANLSGKPLLAYGFRAFSSSNATQDCYGPDDKMVAVCMPKTIRVLDLNITNAGLQTDTSFWDTSSKLGAVALSLDDDRVLLMGGIQVNAEGRTPPSHPSKEVTLLTQPAPAFLKMCKESLNAK